MEKEASEYAYDLCLEVSNILQDCGNINDKCKDIAIMICKRIIETEPSTCYYDDEGVEISDETDYYVDVILEIGIL